MQSLCVAPAYQQGSTNAVDHTLTALRDMEEQLESATSTSFYTYSVTEELDTDWHDYDDSSSDEISYIEACLEELYNKGKTADGDAWIIPDGVEYWGYGRGHVSWTSPDGSQTLWGARVIHTPSQSLVSDPIETYYNLVIHEMGHNLGASHEHGDYDDSSGQIADVTPMATVYAYGKDDHNDTCWENSGGKSDAPDDFCWESNKTDDYLCDHFTCEDTCRHTTSMAYCAKSNIEDNTPL